MNENKNMGENVAMKEEVDPAVNANNNLLAEMGLEEGAV